MNGELFFTADDGAHGSELWRSTGWSEGTAMVSDILAGPPGSLPYWFTGVNGTLFFVADDGAHGYELWRASPNAPLPPAIDGVWPAAGLVGATVTVTGARFVGATAVKLNGASAAFTVLSDTRLTLTVPGGATSGPITVTTPAGTATSAQPFAVVQQPSIDSFTPTNAHVHQTVTVLGRHFTGTTSVAIGAVPVPFAVVSDTTITFTVPPGATDGQVVVTNPAGSASLGGLTVPPPPTITGFTPSAGAVGTLVTVTGTGLDGAVGVMLGSVLTVPASSGDTEVVFRVPPGAATGHIKVLTTAGSVTSAGVFTVTS